VLEGRWIAESADAGICLDQGQATRWHISVCRTALPMTCRSIGAGTPNQDLATWRLAERQVGPGNWPRQLIAQRLEVVRRRGVVR